jgi:PKD repeat protein
VVVINFDEAAAPRFFAETTPLRDEYAHLGITFAGPNANDGGAILNDSTWWPGSGHSPPNILGFNVDATMSNGGTPQGPQTMLFAPPISALSMLAAGDSAGSATLDAFDGGDNLVESSTIELTTAGVTLSVSGHGIERAVVSFTTPHLLLDDLTFSPNHPPVADAGPNQTVTLGSGGTADVKLDGSGSSDPDGDALTYTWTGGFQGGSASGVSPTVTFTAAGTHTVTLTVDDGLATDTDTVRITVRAADTAPGPYPPNECSDVPRNVYYTTPFDWAWHTGVTTGVGGSNRCEPLRDVTRAEAVTVLWRTMGSPQVATPHPFTDTVAGAYYQPALRWAAANRHTTGIGGTEANPSSTFGPDLVADRAEQFTFVWRVMGRPGGPQHPFVDVVPGSFYHPAVNWAADTGVTTGYAGSNRFEPHILVDRAQMFTIAYRLFS